MKKNIPMFVAIFTIALTAGFFALPADRAAAYAIGQTGTAAATGSSSYDFNSSLQNLISPFTGFMNDLKWNNNTSITTNGSAGYTPPNLNMGPGLTNIFTNWLNQFNGWVYARTGIKLSGIVYVFLNILSWTLHLAEAAVNWLLGLFH